MATIRIRGKMLHIQWYDPFEQKVKSMATGFVANETNIKKAEKFAKQLQSKLTREYMKQKELGIQKVTVKEAFEHFERINQDKNPKTLADYRRFYKKFTEAFNEDLSCTNINKLNVENWLLEIKQLKLSKNTIHAYGKQLNHFLNFLFEYNYTTMFKINRQVKTRPEVKDKIVFTDEALTTIVKGLKSKNSNFNTAINLLMYTGLRSSDILSIKVSDIDFRNQILKYYSPKRKKFREIAFHKKLIPILKMRIKDVSGEKLLDYNNVENLGRAIKRYFKDIKIDYMIYTARTFRKTFISLCRSRYDIDASVVMELVGHEPMNTTDRYYNKVSIEKMKKDLEKFVVPIVKQKAKSQNRKVTTAITMATDVKSL